MFKPRNWSRSIFILLLCLTQNYAEGTEPLRNFYLVDSLDFEKIDENDRVLIDTTLTLYHQEENDTLKLDLLNHLINYCIDPNVWPMYNEVLRDYSLTLLSRAGQADQWYRKVASMHALALNNEGFHAYYQGDFTLSLEKLYQSLDLRERIGDKSGVSECYNNIGGIHYSQRHYDKALDLFKKSLALKIEIGESPGIATAYNNIGAIYNDMNLIDSAEYYYLKCLDIYVDLNDNLGLGLIYHNLGSIYIKKNQLDRAEWFFNHSIDINLKEGQSQLLSNSHYLLSKMYFDLGSLALAEKYAKISLDYANEIGFPDDIKDPAGMLSDIYTKQRKYQDALEMYQLYVTMKDSSFSEEIKQEVEARNLQYTFEKKALADSIRFAHENSINQSKIAEQDAIIKQKHTLNYSLVIGFVLLGALTVLILIALRNKKRANAEIEKQKLQVEQQRDIINEKHKLTIDQKKMLEEQNQEIKDSITYAKRLQDAILPSSETVQSALPDSFILYKPKDIVAGDFYWVEEIDNIVYFAAADCTGHGVPGAFVSIVCSNALNQAILELGICHPAQLLERVTQLVVKTFEKSNQSIKDGMDIAVCAMNKSTRELQYAGANNPLWIISSNNITYAAAQKHEVEFAPSALYEIKATKRPVGKYAADIPFEQHTLKLDHGDIIYLLSDGFADQFGGENLPSGKGRGKKFKYKQLKELLLRLQPYSMVDQKSHLNVSFEKWRGSFEQLDDVCVIGVKV